MSPLDYQSELPPQTQTPQECLKTITQLPTAIIDLLANFQQQQFTNYCRYHHIDTLLTA